MPSEHLEKLWEGYERFERSSAGRNNLAAQRFLDDARPRFYAAREAWAARRRLLRPLERDALPWLPGLSPPSARTREQRAAWLSLLEFEIANAQGIEREAHRKRVDLTFRQALQPLRGCPEVRHVTLPNRTLTLIAPVHSCVHSLQHGRRQGAGQPRLMQSACQV